MHTKTRAGRTVIRTACVARIVLWPHNFALFLGPQMWIMRGSCVQSAITVRHFVSRKSTYSKWDLASDVVGFHHVLNSAKKSEFVASIKRSLQKKNFCWNTRKEYSTFIFISPFFHFSTQWVFSMYILSSEVIKKAAYYGRNERDFSNRI